MRRLSDEEHEVLNVDSAGEQSRSLVLVDLTDCREVLETDSDPATVHIKMLSTCNVFPAARRREIRADVERDPPGPDFRYRFARCFVARRRAVPC